MKQDTKAKRVAAQLMAAALSVLLLFSLSGCSFFGPKEERTEWIVDGEYTYLGEEETVEALEDKYEDESGIEDEDMDEDESEDENVGFSMGM